MCPECGRRIDAPHRNVTRAVVTRAAVAIVGFALLTPILALALPRRTAQLISHLLPTHVRARVHQFGHVRVSIERPFELPSAVNDALRRVRIEILPAFESRLRVVGRGFSFVTSGRDLSLGAPGSAPATLGLNDDLDGDAIPDLIINSFSGGAHCCWTCTIIRLGDHPAILAELFAEHGAAFERISDAHGIHTVITTIDAVWDYWGSCYACTPKPSLVFRLRHARLDLAPDLMRRPLPASSALDAAAANARELVRASKGRPIDSDVPGIADLWRLPVELVYTGHPAAARRLLRDSWPEDVAGFDEFLAAFDAQLAKSPHWMKLRESFRE